MENKTEPSRYRSSDARSQENMREYEELVSAITQRLDPDSNTVLVVDDEEGIRRFVARNIKRNDRKTVIYEAENGEEALEQLELIRTKFAKDPLFIVTDLNMPIMDGWEFIRTLQKQYEEAGKEQGIPVIVLSSTSGEKGMIFKQSVHSGKTKYRPLVSIAKEVCMQPAKFDAQGEKGLMRWMKHFMRYS
jgi:CheY-like chemotaxis protein